MASLEQNIKNRNNGPLYTPKNNEIKKTQNGLTQGAVERNKTDRGVVLLLVYLLSLTPLPLLPPFHPLNPLTPNLPNPFPLNP